MKHLVLKGIVLSALLLVQSGSNHTSAAQSAVTTNRTSQEEARRLTQQGHQFLDQGNPSAALQTWQRATKLYGQMQNQEGVTGSEINQSRAMQALGQYSNACNVLVNALLLEKWLCQTQFVSGLTPNQLKQDLTQPLQKTPSLAIHASGLQNLGDVLWQIGKPNESEVILQRALEISQAQSSLPDQQGMLLSVANTQRGLSREAVHLYQQTDNLLTKPTAALQAQEKAQEALRLYQQIAGANVTEPIAIKARVKWLSLVLELEQWNKEYPQKLPALVALLEKHKPQTRANLRQLLTQDLSQLPVIESVYVQISLGESLLRISQNQTMRHLLPSGEQEALLTALSLAQAAMREAQQVDSQRGESLAYGLAGQLYRHTGQLSEAKAAFAQAMSLAQSVNAPDLAYQWQDQLGQLYEQQGDDQKALQTYAAAIDNLEAVRTTILSVTPDIQFYFKERVEPVYRSYMRLLLAANNPNLERVIDTNEKLRLAELQNYLRCQRPDLVSLEAVRNPAKDTAVIHLIDLGGRFVEIVQAPDQSLHLIKPSDSKSIERTVSNLLKLIQVDSYSGNSLALKPEETIVKFSGLLYQQLITPIKPHLPNSGTLIFVLDSRLQGIPMALLHDGSQYLVQKYSISETTGVEIQRPRKLQRNKMRTLIAALSQISPSFKAPNAPPGLFPLSKVLGEVNAIKAVTDSSEVLIDTAFTAERLRENVERQDYPILHISSHGQFSSDPAQTVILAWDKPIDVRQFNLLLRSNSQASQAPIELLVLSACETAKGDQRSALGLAGIAAQAGAMNTLASLWLVDETATATLMKEFYLGLSQGLSKAEALRQAQIRLIQNPQTRHPFYWSPFIMVGSGL